MYKIIICFLFIFIFQTCKSTSFDSLMFSDDGKYVLQYGGNDLTNCEIDYWELYQINKQELSSYVIIYNDSVFLLTFDTLCSGLEFERENCKTWARIQNIYQSAVFINMYNLRLKSIEIEPNFTIKIDTLTKYNKELEFSTVSAEYSNIQIKIYNNEILVYSNIISTNVISEDFFKRLKDLKIYYSIDRKFYYLKGVYFYTELLGFGASKTQFIDIRKIGENYR